MGKIRLPLYGKRAEGVSFSGRGLVVKSSDCDGFAPPDFVTEKHGEIQEQIDKRKVKDGEVYGWIEHNGESVTGWEVDEKIL